MVQKALKEVADDATGVGPVILCGRSAPVERVRAALLGAKWSNTSAVESFAIRRLRPEDRTQLVRASVVVYGGEVTHTLDDATRADLEVVGRAGRPLLVVLEGVELPMDGSVEAARVRGIEPEHVLATKSGHFPAKRVLRLIAAQAGTSGPALAARLPALRPLVVETIIETAARRNALIAAAVWIPGADMPLLTAVEMRMVLHLGVCYGVEVGADRAVELLGLLGAGFGLRTAARELLDVVPVAGWVVKGGVAYSGTRAIGRAAVEYFEHGAVADVSKLRTLAERLRS
ncbi:MAG TPA: DUF697 domain-containing protein [Gaiellales bacterium]|jgi:uncharacterized protein (DUF697 family)